MTTPLNTFKIQLNPVQEHHKYASKYCRDVRMHTQQTFEYISFTEVVFVADVFWNTLDCTGVHVLVATRYNSYN